MQRNFYLQRPIMAYPPYHSNQTLSPAPIYPMWGQPGGQMAGVQIWGSPPAYPLWHPTESWNWKPYPGVIPSNEMLFHIIKCFCGMLCRNYVCSLIFGDLMFQMHVDAWGCPLFPPPQAPGFPYNQVSFNYLI